MIDWIKEHPKMLAVGLVAGLAMGIFLAWAYGVATTPYCDIWGIHHYILGDC